MKAPKKPIKTKDLELTPLPLRRIETKDLPGATPSKEIKTMIAGIANKAPDLIKSYLKLSAANTIESKGHINAVGCRSIYPEGPSIHYNAPLNDYTGHIEIWLKNISKGDSFAISFRVLCAAHGQWKLSSSETSHQFRNILLGYDSVDLFIPAVNNDYGMALVRLEPQFDNDYGSWSFFDVTVRKVTFE